MSEDRWQNLNPYSFFSRKSYRSIDVCIHFTDSRRLPDSHSLYVILKFHNAKGFQP